MRSARRGRFLVDERSGRGPGPAWASSSARSDAVVSAAAVAGTTSTSSSSASRSSARSSANHPPSTADTASAAPAALRRAHELHARVGQFLRELVVVGLDGHRQPNGVERGHRVEVPHR
ncbi:MAG: hypothetical protein R2695_11590 [Acidimicrobiales bacterium]